MGPNRWHEKQVRSRLSRSLTWHGVGINQLRGGRAFGCLRGLLLANRSYARSAYAYVPRGRYTGSGADAVRARGNNASMARHLMTDLQQTGRTHEAAADMLAHRRPTPRQAPRKASRQAPSSPARLSAVCVHGRHPFGTESVHGARRLGRGCQEARTVGTVT